MSVSSEEGAPLLGQRSLPPASMRSSKSVVTQVKDTLFSFLKKAKVVKSSDEKEAEDAREDGETPPSISLRFSPEVIHSRSQKQRTREAFFERVTSFSVTHWMGKPLALSPPLLAQYGWQCIGLDSLKCCSCSAILAVRLPWPDADNYRKQCLESRQKILTAHMKICSWPSCPCPDSFINPFLHVRVDSDQVWNEYNERRRNLLKLGSKLPQMRKDILDELNLDQEKLDIITKDEGEYQIMEYETATSKLSRNISAAILAMCGWDTDSTMTSTSPRVYCKSTGRKVGLWNFYSYHEEVPPDTECVSGTAVDSPSAESHDKTGSKRPSEGQEGHILSPKRLKTNEGLPSSPSHLKIEKQYFHPLQQHNPWSPWIIVLKPISQKEFEDVEEGDQAPPNNMDDEYRYIVTPAIEGEKPAWAVVRDTLVGKRMEKDVATSQLSEDAENSKSMASDGETSGDPNTPSSKQKLITLTPQRTSPKNAVIHVRRMMKEWS